MTNCISNPNLVNAPTSALALRDASHHLQLALAAITAAITLDPQASTIRLGLQAKALLQAVNREAGT